MRVQPGSLCCLLLLVDSTVHLHSAAVLMIWHDLDDSTVAQLPSPRSVVAVAAVAVCMIDPSVLSWWWPHTTAQSAASPAALPFATLVVALLPRVLTSECDGKELVPSVCTIFVAVRRCVTKAAAVETADTPWPLLIW